MTIKEIFEKLDERNNDDKVLSYANGLLIMEGNVGGQKEFLYKMMDLNYKDSEAVVVYVEAFKQNFKSSELRIVDNKVYIHYSPVNVFSGNIADYKNAKLN